MGVAPPYNSYPHSMAPSLGTKPHVALRNTTHLQLKMNRYMKRGAPPLHLGCRTLAVGIFSVRPWLVDWRETIRRQCCGFPSRQYPTSDHCGQVDDALELMKEEYNSRIENCQHREVRNTPTRTIVSSPQVSMSMHALLR